MVLREIRIEDKDELYEMYNEYNESELIPGLDRFEAIRDLEDITKYDFNEWLEQIEKNKYEENLPETHSPQTIYLGINEENQIVGAISLRWKAVPALMTFGGFIGYSVRPKYRGKGYANDMLKLALDKFKEKNIEDILIICKDFNIASKKIIEKNGGILENVLFNSDDGYNYLRYWIKVNNK